MLKFPMKFNVEACSASGTGTPWTAKAGSLPPISSAIPPEFMGPGGGYSPEDLFALSIVNCILATYKVYCEKSNITFSEIQGKAELFVDQREGLMMMTQIDISLNVVGASDCQKARKILEHAIRDCAVGNSIKTGKTFKISVN